MMEQTNQLSHVTVDRCQKLLEQVVAYMKEASVPVSALVDLGFTTDELTDCFGYPRSAIEKYEDDAYWTGQKNLREVAQKKPEIAQPDCIKLFIHNGSLYTVLTDNTNVDVEVVESLGHGDGFVEINGGDPDETEEYKNQYLDRGMTMLRDIRITRLHPVSTNDDWSDDDAPASQCEEEPQEKDEHEESWGCYPESSGCYNGGWCG